MSVDERLSELGIELPPAAAPVASYIPVVVSNGLAFVSGQVPMEEGKPIYLGRLGAEVSEEDGAAAARRAGMSLRSCARTSTSPAAEATGQPHGPS